ncbi:unnamed protein product [Caenorhabditis bovis]|uniref:HECT domain-containing protein n=1 Tax=Caenorhabditis bovis TaxID=2654633 RepID=A0A8S1F8M9_9PELO|nr:unnamed protein product [Caenorhabditis bovis]
MRSELLGCGQAVEGQLGVRLPEPTLSVPEQIIGAPSDATGTLVKSVACGENHTLFLTENGKMWSVGGNQDGQLGRGNHNEGSFSIFPVSCSSGVSYIQIAAGRAHSLALAEDGRVFAWGSNEHGQLALPSNTQRQEVPKRIQVLSEVVQIACGSDSCVALTEGGHVYVWGEQADGRCLHEPTEIEELYGIPIVRILSGSRHCLAISASGAVFGWGQNDHGQLGHDDLTPQKKIRQINQMDGMKVVEGACGDRHSVLLTNCGRVFTFGSDSLGQCGFDKKIEKRTSPTAVTELIGSTVTRIAAGRCHTITVIGGYVYAFGLNSSGQLGNGGLRTMTIPRKNDMMDHVSNVFAGWDQTFFLRSSDAKNQTVGPNSAIKRPLGLNRKILEERLKTGDKLQVIELIESVFSSVSCLNNSFLFQDDRVFDAGRDSTVGIDFDEAMEALQLFSGCASAKQYCELMIEMLSMSLFTHRQDFASIEALRVYILAPWFPCFTEFVTYEVSTNLHEGFARSINSLNGGCKNLLVNLYARLPVRYFRRTINVLKIGVREYVKRNKGPAECEMILTVLSFLNQINSEKHIVPTETFYLDELNSAFDLKLDYYSKVVDLTRNGNNSKNFWSSYPFLLNALAKVDLLHAEAVIMRSIRVGNTQVQIPFFGTAYIEVPFLEIHVRREFIVSDTMNKLAEIDPSDLLKPLKVKIQGEEADDAGGVRKEFFMIVMQKILQPDYGMFVEDPNSHLVWFSGLSNDFCGVEQFKHFGRLVGLAVYNQVIFSFPFPLALYKLLLDEHPNLEDLCDLSPIEGKSLQSLLDYEGDDFEDVFCLDFTITYDLVGEKIVEELVPNGKQKMVNLENRKHYVELYVKHRLEIGVKNQIEDQVKSFVAGFHDALHSRILSLFKPRELMEMIVGNENYDWSQFREIVEYEPPYDKDHPAIVAFWNAFFRLTDDEKVKFLQFLTGTTRLPVAGMSALGAKIQACAPESLPVAHTCFNLLDLPPISDSDEMYRRLLISIEHTEGFTLVAIRELINAGIRIEAAKRLRIDERMATELYQQHKGKFFYNRLVRHISSGEVIAMRVSGNVRACIGSSRLWPRGDVGQQPLRQRLALSDVRNVAHASDADAAARELELFELNSCQ